MTAQETALSAVAVALAEKYGQENFGFEDQEVESVEPLERPVGANLQFSVVLAIKASLEQAKKIDEARRNNSPPSRFANEPLRFLLIVSQDQVLSCSGIGMDLD